MADVNIGAKLTVDTGNSAADVDKVTQSVNNTSKATKELQAENKSMANGFGELKEKLGGLPGAAGEATEGVSKLNSMFKILIANPIVLVIAAIVAVLAGLYKAFTSTFEGGQKVQQVFAGIKAAAEVVVERLIAFGNAIIKFFSGDFSGAISDAKKAVSGIGDEIAETYNKMSSLVKEAQSLHKEQLANDLDQAERAKRLAILREQANDESVPIAKRKAALQELKKDAEQNAKDDIDLAKRTTANKIAQLSIGLDAEKKNQDEINKLKIEQINVETENANELRRIDKQLKATQKQEAAEAKAEADKRKAEEKEKRQELVEYTNKLLKLQQENELAIIQDSYAKEQKQLENKIADDKRANDVAFQDKKLTRLQFDTLNAELDKQYALQSAALRDKQQKEQAQKTLEFQKELNTIVETTKLNGITDAREKEKVQLSISYEQQRAQILINEKTTADQKQQLLNALADQNHAQKVALDKKFAEEDAAKALKDQQTILKADYDLKAANNQLSYQDKLDYYNKTRDLERQDLVSKKATATELLAFDEETTAGHIALSNAKRDTDLNNASTVGNALGALSQLVGEQTVLGKGLAIAQATINTYVGATKALAQGGIFGYIGAAAVIASGLASVKKIVSTDVSGASTTSPSAPSVSVPSAPLQPATTSTTIDPNSVNAIGNATSGRAYVLESDVRNNQERITRLNRAARLG